MVDALFMNTIPFLYKALLHKYPLKVAKSKKHC